MKVFRALPGDPPEELESEWRLSGLSLEEVGSWKISK
jgi:hypothetical protein